MNQVELPLYKCHKTVRALKIKQINLSSGPNLFHCELVFEDSRYGNLPVLEDWYHEHQPDGDGYYVMYEDGHASFATSAAFENVFTLAVDEPTANTQLLESYVAYVQENIKNGNRGIYTIDEWSVHPSMKDYMRAADVQPETGESK
jgi:hypothetical protein